MYLTLPIKFSTQGKLTIRILGEDLETFYPGVKIVKSKVKFHLQCILNFPPPRGTRQLFSFFSCSICVLSEAISHTMEGGVSSRHRFADVSKSQEA